MPVTTPNISLTKPLGGDFFSLDHFNPNWDTLDGLFSSSTGHDHKSRGAPVARLRSGPEASRPTTGNTDGDVWWATDTSRLYVWRASVNRWIAYDSLAENMLQKGDILVATGANTFARLPVGTDGQILAANSVAPHGVAWTDPSVASHGVINADLHPLYTTDAEAQAIVQNMAILKSLLQAKGDLVAATGASTPNRLAAPTHAGRTLVSSPAAATGLAWTTYLTVVEASGTLGATVGDWTELVSFVWDSHHMLMAWLVSADGSDNASFYVWQSAFNATAGAWRLLPPVWRHATTLKALLQINVGYDATNLNRAKLRIQRQTADTVARPYFVVVLAQRLSEVTALSATGNEALVSTLYNADLLPWAYAVTGQARYYAVRVAQNLLPVAAPPAPASGVNLYVSSSDGRLKLGRPNGDVLEMEQASTQYLAWAGM